MSYMIECPNCHNLMCQYKNSGFTENICWNCGEYISDSPAYLAHPQVFKNLIRNNPLRFIKKYIGVPTDEILQRKPTDEDLPEPMPALYKGGIVKNHS